MRLRNDVLEAARGLKLNLRLLFVEPVELNA